MNEIYCLSRQDYSDPLFLSKEIEMFDEGNGYILQMIYSQKSIREIIHL